MANAIEDAIRARQSGYDETQGFFDRETSKRAGRAMAQGDRAAAADELYGAGMIDAGRTLEQEGRQVASDDRRARLEDQKLAREQQEQSATFLKQAATVLRQIPTEARAEAYVSKVAPALKAMGIPDDIIAQAGQHLDDMSLQTFIGEVDNQVKLFNTSSGVVAVNPAALQQNINDPSATRVVYQDPLYKPYREAQIEATQARAGASQASAAASRARAAKTSGGGGKRGAPSAGSPGLPAGFVLDR